LIIDTDVLIWYLKGNNSAKDIVDANIPFSVSSVTYMELIQGMRDKKEFQTFQKQFRKWKTEVIHIDQDISSRAVFYVQEYALSHSMMLADSLIAATVVQNSETLITANDKHYRFIPNIDVIKFSPKENEKK
jgi:predicted nucleic acid-binding protein